jgi:hypothetical protein
VDEPDIYISTVVGNFFGNLQKYQHKEPLQDLGVPGLTVKEFWQHGNKNYTNLSENRLFQNKSM